MSTVTDMPRQPAGMITTIERQHCPQCDGAIPQRLTLSHIDPATPRDVRVTRTTMIRCEHCNKTWSIKATLRGGNWCAEEDTLRQVIFKRELVKFEREIAKKRVA